MELHPTAFLSYLKSGMHATEKLSNNGEVTNKNPPSITVCVLLAPTFVAVPKCFSSSGQSAGNICTVGLFEIKSCKIIY